MKTYEVGEVVHLDNGERVEVLDAKPCGPAMTRPDVLYSFRDVFGNPFTLTGREIALNTERRWH